MYRQRAGSSRGQRVVDAVKPEPGTQPGERSVLLRAQLWRGTAVQHRADACDPGVERRLLGLIERGLERGLQVLPDPWRAAQECRARVEQRLVQLRWRGAERLGGGAHARAPVLRAVEDVRERQVGDLADAVGQVPLAEQAVGHQQRVAVGPLDPLRHAGRARGVEDPYRVIRLDAAPARLEREPGGSIHLAEGGQPSSGAVERHHPGDRVLDGLKAVLEPGFDREHPRVAVTQEMRDRLGRRGGVRGDDRRPEVGGRHGGDRQLRPVVRPQGDAIAAAYPQARERAGQALDCCAVLRPGQALIVAGRAQRNPIGDANHTRLKGER